MSVIYGVLKQKNERVDLHELAELGEPTRRWGPDGDFAHNLRRVGMGYQPYDTHERSSLESGPLRDEVENLVAFDGRLDNHKSLQQQLGLDGEPVSDSFIVLAAFRQWGENSFSRLVGDWSLALWSEARNLLFLARDHAGTRTLYFEQRGGSIYWSTYLETLVRSRPSVSLDLRYAAAFIANQPICELTPYEGIAAVPPAHYLVFGTSMQAVAHWNWLQADTLRYSSETEYEERFLELFKQAVARRTQGGAAILAQLSGGVDSSSIVCVSDLLRRSNREDADLVDTLSYFDESEPNWNEYPYFSAVEAVRGKVGVHIDACFRGQRLDTLSPASACLWPGASDTGLIREYAQEKSLAGKDYRVILSGIGGDELLGGVPNPYPVLADLLHAGEIRGYLGSTLAYCLADRTPYIHRVVASIRYLCSLHRDTVSSKPGALRWATPRALELLVRKRTLSARRPRRWTVRPSAIDKGQSCLSMLETLPHRSPSAVTRREYRYPYLDRDLVEFLLQIPHEQLIRPGRRRYLMRNALKDIVPAIVLERKRKAFLRQSPLACLREHAGAIEELLVNPSVLSLDLVRPDVVKEMLKEVAQGNSPAGWPSLLRFLLYGVWLQASPWLKVGVSSTTAPKFAQRTSCAATSGKR